MVVRAQSAVVPRSGILHVLARRHYLDLFRKTITCCSDYFGKRRRIILDSSSPTTICSPLFPVLPFTSDSQQ